MRKIAILSMQRVVNFGSVLQAYSLREMIRENSNADVEFLDICKDQVIACTRTTVEGEDYQSPAAYPPGLMQKAKRWCIARLSAWNKKKIRRFMKKELKLDQEKTPGIYDCTVVGSDEVFNHALGLNLQLHGNVKQTKKIVSYGAACGCARAEDVPKDSMETVRQAMNQFSAVSVRDGATEEYAATFYDGPIVHHLDPVLVGGLDQRKHRKVFLKRYLLVYAYGQRIRSAQEIQAIQAFAKANKLKTVAMGGSQFWCDLYIPADPLRMLDYFYHADYVVTDTFHGAVFSVICQKRFGVIVRKTNQNKLRGLMQDLGLSGRILQSIDDLTTVLQTPIDYTAVEKIRDMEKERTRAYLKEQLGA